MAIIHKDIDLLSQKQTVTGTEKIPVSDSEFITPAQIGGAGAVKYSEAQALSDAQKAQARANISTLGYVVNGSGQPGELGLEQVLNKVTSLSASSTDTEYPSAKAVYDHISSIVGNIETLLAAI